MVHASPPVCRASSVRRRRYKSSRFGTHFHPSVPGVYHMRRRRNKGSRCGSRFHPCVQGVQHEVCACAENYGLIQKIVALHLELHWQKINAHLRGAAQRVHASMDSGAHWAAWTWQFAW